VSRRVVDSQHGNSIGGWTRGAVDRSGIEVGLRDEPYIALIVSHHETAIEYLSRLF
jgi:hypothetical protein